MERRTAELLDEVGEDSSARGTLVRRLSVAQQQVVEIVKALSLDARMLVMDEPTAALAEHEVELLYGSSAGCASAASGCSTSRTGCARSSSICDRITVLKDGAQVATRSTAEVDTGELVPLMVGRELDGYFPPRGTAEDVGDVRLAGRAA